MMASSRQDQGFVLLDALLATALVAAAGTTIVLIAGSILAEQDRQLERSAALLMAETAMREYTAFGSASASSADERFRYDVVATGAAVPGTSQLEAMAVVALPKAGGEEVLRLDFLARGTDR